MGIGTTLLIISVLVVGVLTLPDAYSITRSEINTMKVNIDDLRVDVKAYDEDILEIQLDIKSKEIELISDITAEKVAQEWDRLVNTEGSRDELRDKRSSVVTTEKELTNLNTSLQNKINQKLAAQNTLIQLEKQVKLNEDLIKKNSKIELQGLTRVIGIELSKTCVTMLTNNFTTNCPSYEELIQLDNSKPESGEFRIIDGLFQRDTPSYQNDHKLYDFEKDFTIIVNPSGNIASRIKVITIENSMDTYLTAFDGTKSNNTRTVNHDRYVDSCKNSTISAKNWLVLLPDTIHYLRTGCEITKFDSVEIIKDPITNIDITTSRHWQEARALENNKIKCKGLCFEY